MSALTQALRDSSVITWRNWVGMKRVPDALIGLTVQPIMFVVLFALVFAGSLGGEPYREFLVAGIFAQTVAFNVFFTTIGMANDLGKGIIDRFRSLPMSRVAVVLGRAVSDLGVTVITLVVMSLTGLIVGWRIRGGVLDALAGYGVLLLFSFAMAWIGVFVGLVARNVEVAQSAGLIWLFPLTFVSSAFVSVQGFPGWLQPFGEWNPVSAVARASRELFGNPTQLPGFAESTAWPAQHAVLYAVLSSLAIVAIFLPLAAARYRRVASR
ncbi:ABC transporter permease [Pseudonocardia sp. N23]|uniref:ABC transporter permease n=1 Tax=Pseudonocardia sp. N23 TaxID=1987376 RepID=UPI000BFBA59B|nr:ABC transporter permease [Pseudonocardia sp. N23]GAY12856.1 putative ABC transporter membrane protein [Pseudonocardia sp. N23]